MSDSSLRARVGAESGEGSIGALRDKCQLLCKKSGQRTYGRLDIGHTHAGREVRRGLEIRGGGKNVGAVGQSRRIVTELAHSLKDKLESILELSLVGCVMFSA